MAAFKLLPGYENASSPTSAFTIVDGAIKIGQGESFKDKKLARQPLDISLLILALLKYKDIISDVDSERASDIDLYIPILLELHTKYPGHCYWYYHSYF